MARKRPDTTRAKARSRQPPGRMTRKRPDATRAKTRPLEPVEGDGALARLLFALNDAAESSSRRRARGAVPEPRPYLIGALGVLIQAKAAGVSPSLSPEDAQLATKAWRLANMMLTCAAALDAGDGNQQERTPHFRCEFASIREMAHAVIAKVDEVAEIKRLFNMHGDELAVLLKSRLQHIFKKMKQLRKKLPRDQLVELFMAMFADVTDAVSVDFDRAEVEKICVGPLAQVLDGYSMPSRAAVDATVILLRQDYQVAPDAVREGAAKRVARRIK